MNNKNVIAVISYSVSDEDESKVTVGFTELSRGFLSTLTDFELKVFAAEVGLAVRKAFEMPPSPAPKE